MVYLVLASLLMPIAIEPSPGAFDPEPQIKSACAGEANAPTTATLAATTLALPDFPRAVAISATATQVLVLSFHTTRYVLFIITFPTTLKKQKETKINNYHILSYISHWFINLMPSCFAHDNEY